MLVDAPAHMLAEQIAVDCRGDDASDLLGRPPLANLSPLLRLAGDAGEAAGMVVLGTPTPPGVARSHDLTSSVTGADDRSVEVAFEWRTGAYRALFEVLSGRLRARCADAGVILSIEGVYVLGPALHDQPLGTAAGRRAAEVAVRALLAHLRSALEHRPTS